MAYIPHPDSIPENLNLLEPSISEGLPSRSWQVCTPSSHSWQVCTPARHSWQGWQIAAASLVLLIAVGVCIVCIVGVVLPQGGECSTPVTDLLTGEYQLEYYDKEYTHLLSAMGVPEQVQSLILTVSEHMTVTLTGSTGVRIHTVTDYQTTESEFQLDREFRRPYGNNRLGGTMVTTCSRPTNNNIVCRSEEAVQGWLFLSQMMFYPGGMIKNRTLVSNNISSSQYYQRVGAQQTIQQIIQNMSHSVDGLLEAG